MYKTLKSKIVYQNPWIKLREDIIKHPDGKDGIYGVLEANPGVIIVARKNKKYLVNKQFRYPTNQFSWEFPAGGLEKDESIEECALREFEEETFYKATTAKVIGSDLQAFNGISNGRTFVVLVDGLSEKDSHERLADGITESAWKTKHELDSMIKRGEFTDVQCIAALFLATNLD